MEKTSTSYYEKTRRSDGESTRNDLLNAAGQIFAEVGYAEATNKAISERAGTNSAAISYYFGGKEGLYEAVLVEAHRQFISLEELEAIILSNADAEGKLKAALHILVERARRSSELWGMSVLLREILGAPDFPPRPLLDAVLPKLALLRSLVREITGFSEGSPEERYASAFLALPNLALVLFPSKLKGVLLPEMQTAPEAFENAVFSYVLGGLRAMRETLNDKTIK